MDPHRRELLDVLRETRAMLARPDNEFMWSSWEDADAALSEVDGLIERLEAGGLPYRTSITILFDRPFALGSSRSPSSFQTNAARASEARAAST